MLNYQRVYRAYQILVFPAAASWLACVVDWCPWATRWTQNVSTRQRVKGGPDGFSKICQDVSRCKSENHSTIHFHLVVLPPLRDIFVQRRYWYDDIWCYRFTHLLYSLSWVYLRSYVSLVSIKANFVALDFSSILVRTVGIERTEEPIFRTRSQSCPQKLLQWSRGCYNQCWSWMKQWFPRGFRIERGLFLHFFQNGVSWCTTNTVSRYFKLMHPRLLETRKELMKRDNEEPDCWCFCMSAILFSADWKPQGVASSRRWVLRAIVYPQWGTGGATLIWFFDCFCMS